MTRSSGRRSAKSPATDHRGINMKVNGTQYRAVWWDDGAVGYIDQRLLPHRFETGTAGTTLAVADASTGLAVRGAPTIGVMAGYGLALASMLGENL